MDTMDNATRVSLDRPTDQSERRAFTRFPIERTIRYRVLVHGRVAQSGRGKTVNMSSGGLLIATDRVLSTGCRLEVEIAGPFHTDDKIARRLILTGRIVRTETGTFPLAGLKISRHKFQLPDSHEPTRNS